MFTGLPGSSPIPTLGDSVRCSGCGIDPHEAVNRWCVMHLMLEGRWGCFPYCIGIGMCIYIYTNTWIYVHIYICIYIHIAPFPTMSFQSQQINSRDVASSLPLRCALNHSPKPSDMSRPRAQKGQPWQTQSSGARKPHREAWKLHPWLSRYVSENEGTPSSKNHHFPWGNPWFWGVSPFSGRVHEGPSS